MPDFSLQYVFLAKLAKKSFIIFALLRFYKFEREGSKKGECTTCLSKLSNQLIHDLIDWKDFSWQTKRQY